MYNITLNGGATMAPCLHLFVRDAQSMGKKREEHRKVCLCECVCLWVGGWVGEVKHPSVSSIPVQTHPAALSKPGPITAPEQSHTCLLHSALFISSLFANFNLH